jgi:hypothetical protein
MPVGPVAAVSAVAAVEVVVGAVVVEVVLAVSTGSLQERRRMSEIIFHPPVRC